jgi:hypothetical protein
VESGVFVLFVILPGLLLVVGMLVVGIILRFRQEANNQEKTRLTHAERLRALELGQPLREHEVARAHAEASRARAAGLIGTLVPLAAIGAAAGISLAILREPFHGNWTGLHPTTEKLLVVWVVAGVVSLVAVVGTLIVLQRLGPPAAPAGAPPAAGPPPPEFRPPGTAYSVAPLEGPRKTS